MDANVFVQNVKALCKNKGIKPTIACEDSGAGKYLLYHIESRGSIPSVEKVQKLAEYLGVTTSELLGEKIEPTVNDDGLTEEERTLIARFRHLTPENQDAVLRIVQSAADKLG